MTSIADQVAGTPVAGAAEAPREAATPARAPAISLPAIGERELRLDLFRGLALWLIYIDHLPPSLLTWFTIRNYGFSDATEIFIDRKSTRLNSSHRSLSRMPSSA